MSETATIATGAPRSGHDDTAIGYFYTLPLTATPPADATTAPTGTPLDGGYVGEDGPTLTAEIDAEMIKDWNLDGVVQVKTGTTATLEIPVFGWSIDQAKLIYGADSVETLEYNLGGNGKSQILGTTGFVKLVRQKDGPVVGVHMIGARVGELIGEGQLIVNWEAYPEDVAALVHAHPTQNEALGEAHLALAGKPLHAHN